MKRVAALLVLFCVFGAVACSSDSSDESAEIADGSDSVELTMQSDTSELEAALKAQQERIDALEAQLANLPAGPAGPVNSNSLTVSDLRNCIDDLLDMIDMELTYKDTGDVADWEVFGTPSTETYYHNSWDSSHSHELSSTWGGKAGHTHDGPKYITFTRPWSC